MGVVIMGLTVGFAWLFALLGWDAIGAEAGDTFATSAMRWMMFLPIGIQFLISAFMHTVLAKKTAAMIGWQTNGFQYEIGFASLGIGIAGLVSCYLGPEAWLPLSIVVTVFLLGATANHILEMARDKNFKPGNSLILIYDIGLPVSLWALLIFGGLLP
ncbi:MAG: stearoyl-CoA 9-desaturase [Actinobacteria bacterium]|nr:stearoyl-CoA 9-desaturase [Actinomycetota bacterium]MCB9412479.1 stearoyl-CoA 9-desaturase [Actinomycetota bacterium]